jgi:hypothetical protein
MPDNMTLGKRFKWSANGYGPEKRAYIQQLRQLRNSDSQKKEELQAKKRPRHEQMLLGEVKAMLIFRY